MSHVSCYIATFFSKLFPQMLLHSRVTYFIFTAQHNLTGTGLESGIQMLPSLKSPECFVKYSESWLWTIACRTLSQAGLTNRVQPYFQLLYFYLLVFSVVCWDYLCLYQAIRIQVKYLVRANCFNCLTFFLETSQDNVSVSVVLICHLVRPTFLCFHTKVSFLIHP